MGEPAAHRTRPEPELNRGQSLYTPTQAAEILSVKESWLRRQAGQRNIPCTFLGKHLRFSDADLTAIVDQGRRSTRAHRRASRTA